MSLKYQTQSKKHEANSYSHDVLNGNWFERRLEGHLDKTAIVPCITGKSDCVTHSTTYSRDYVRKLPPLTKCGFNSDDKQTLRLDAYRNRIKSTSGNINLNDGDKFLNNLTTTTDISYRILPQLVAGSSKRKHLEQDPFGLYGNATKTGLLACRRYEEKMEKLKPLDLTVTKTDFVPLPIKPIVIMKGRK